MRRIFSKAYASNALDMGLLKLAQAFPCGQSPDLSIRGQHLSGNALYLQRYLNLTVLAAGYEKFAILIEVNTKDRLSVHHQLVL